MPVSFCPAKHQAKSVKLPEPNETTPVFLLRRACPHQHRKMGELLQSSFGSTDTNNPTVVSHGNGFVDTVIDAYNMHYALIIRPDDVWLAILTQFSFYVNGNAELLRSQFVAHEGKRELVIKGFDNRYKVDFGRMSRQMTELILQNVVDPTLQEWIMPDFSTTTITDATVRAMVMMSTMKAYFSYKMMLLCGIPRVTLEGEKEDWVKILERLEKLKEYGIQAVAWYHLLVPVIRRFVKAFDDPDGSENIEFWQKVAHYQGGGSGPRYYAGWITAFCAFNEKGHWIGVHMKDPETSVDPKSLSAPTFWEVYTKPVQEIVWGSPRSSKPYLTLDGTIYHRVDTNDIPSGFTEVDVKLDDDGVQFDTIITAGLVGSDISSSGNTKLSPSGEHDTIRPVTGWWMFVKQLENDIGEGDPDTPGQEDSDLGAGLAFDDDLDDQGKDTGRDNFDEEGEDGESRSLGISHETVEIILPAAAISRPWWSQVLAVLCCQSNSTDH